LSTDTSIAPTKKGKSKLDDALPPAIHAIPPVTTAPGMPKETQAVAIKHIDANVAAVTDSISSLVRYVDEKSVEELRRHASLTQNVEDLLSAVETLHDPSCATVDADTHDTTIHEDVKALIHSNNDVVSAIMGLREGVKVNVQSVESLWDYVTSLTTVPTAAPGDVLVPAVK
jgi:hypothetical protein